MERIEQESASVSTVMKKSSRPLTKKIILARIDQIQSEESCDRQRAFVILRDSYPEMWDALGAIFADERAQAA